jgi:hypothetical protein
MLRNAMGIPSAAPQSRRPLPAAVRDAARRVPPTVCFRRHGQPEHNLCDETGGSRFGPLPLVESTWTVWRAIATSCGRKRKPCLMQAVSGA